MSDRPWHKRYHSDALQGMMPLTLEERGAYQTVLDLIYDRGGPIADNERLLAGYMNCSVRKWRSIRDSLIESGKLVVEDGRLGNLRAFSVLENEAKTRRKRVESGASGGRKKAENLKNNNENNETDLASARDLLEQKSSYTRANKRLETRALPNGNDESSKIDLEKLLWSQGLEIVHAANIPDPKARSLMGKWRKGTTDRLGKADGDAKLLALLAQSQTDHVVDLVPWMTAAIKNIGNRRETREEREARERAEFLERNYGADSPRAKAKTTQH